MKRMRKKKNRYRIAALCIAMFCIAAAWVSKNQCWKLFSQTINTKQFEAVSRSHDAFVGMKITDVLRLVTKDDPCFVFTRSSTCMGMPYEEIIALYPEMTLTPPRDQLYCVAVHSAMSPEETYPQGFFVDQEGIVVEPPIAVSIYW